MVDQHYDLIVIGSGIIGLSIAVESAYALPGKVACLDSLGVANSVGASGDGLRLFRLSYFEHAGYVPLLRDAIEGWRSLGDDLYVPVGGLYAGEADSILVSGSLESALEHSIEHRLLTAKEVRDQFPQFELPANYVGFFETDGGYVRAAMATRTMAEKAERLGVELRNDRAIDISTLGNRWIVKSEARTYICDRLVVAAGAATPDLVPKLKPFINRDPHLVVWFDSPDWNQLPGFGIMDENEEMLYGFPAVDETPGVKVGGHYRFENATMSEQEEGLIELTSRFLPQMSRTIVRRRSCDYDVSPDGHFILGEVEPGLTVACGFSGHGFKFGSVIGKMMQELYYGECPEEWSFLDVARFISTED